MQNNQAQYNYEMIQVRRVFEYLADGNMEAGGALIFIKGNYKEWGAIFKWFKVNNIRGKALAELFKNESPDGGGYHMGVTHILSRMKGKKFSTETIKVNELL